MRRLFSNLSLTQKRLATGLIIFALLAYAPEPLNDFRSPARIGFFVIYGLLVVTLLLRWPPANRFFTRIQTASLMFLRIPRWLFLSVLFVFFLSLTVHLSGVLFHHLPHINDTINQYINAKFLASGHITGTAHPLQTFFETGWMFNDNGKLYAPYSPAPIFLLALGHLLHLPWLINPLMGALTVVAIYFLGREIGGEAIGRLSAFLACICTFMIFMSSEYMNHALSLLCATCFMLFFIRTLKYPNYENACLAAIFLGILVLTRPITAVAICIPYIFTAVIYIIRNPKKYLPLFIVLGCVVLLVSSLQGWYNLHTTGDFSTNAYYKMMGAEAMPGFRKTVTSTYGVAYSPGLAIIYTSVGVDLLDKMLFDWPVPSLFFVILLVMDGKLRPRECELLGVSLALVITYFFFEGSHEIFGPRYYYEATSALLILTAVGIARLPLILRRALHLKAPLPVLRGITILMLIIIIAIASQKGWPERYDSYATHYWEGDVDDYDYMRTHVKTPALVFVPGDHIPYSEYLHVAFENPPSDAAPIVYARDLGDADTLLMRYYPYRNVYVVSGGLVHLIATPEMQCLYLSKTCDEALEQLHIMGVVTTPSCQTKNLSLAPAWPTNTLLAHSFCDPLWIKRLRDATN